MIRIIGAVKFEANLFGQRVGNLNCIASFLVLDRFLCFLIDNKQENTIADIAEFTV